MASRIGRLLARTFVEPLWVAGPQHIETWTCGACGRDIERPSPAVKGIWVAPTPDELVALCARQHQAHDRRGVVVVEPDGAVEASWVPVVSLDEGSFVALVPPAGLVCTPERDGGYVVTALDGELTASDLVGHPPAAVGRHVGRLPAEAVERDAGGRPVAVAAAHLPVAVGSRRA